MACEDFVFLQCVGRNLYVLEGSKDREKKSLKEWAEWCEKNGYAVAGIDLYNDGK